MTVCDLCAGEDEGEMGEEDGGDSKNLTKRDIHTINEQKRRDVIKVVHKDCLCNVIFHSV